MCFPCVCLVELISLAPLTLTLIMPMFGSIFGVKHVLRMSLVLYFYATTNHYLSRQLGIFGPFLSGLTLVMAFTLQLVVVPAPLLWFYEVTLWSVEPLMELVEVVMIVSSTMKASCWLMDLDDDHPPIGKVSVIVISMTSFTLTSLFLWSTSSADDYTSQWLIYGLVTLYIVTTLLTIVVEEGCISDVAVVCMTSSLALVVSGWERQACEGTLLGNGSTQVDSAESKTLLEMVLSMPQMSLQYANRPIAVFQRIFSLPFWLVVALRVVSALWFLLQLHTWWTSSDDDDEEKTVYLDSDEDEEADYEDAPWWFYHVRRYVRRAQRPGSLAGPITLRMILGAIFVYTQLIVVHLSRGHIDCVDDVGGEHAWSQHVLHSGSFRLLLQCFGAVGVYWWKLIKPFQGGGDDYDWSSFKFN